MIARAALLLVSTCLLGVGSQLYSEDVQKRADAMMQRAREFSDIRSPNAPAFRLRATFSFTGDDLETIEGTYTEVWVSNSQWRRETTVKDARRVEVGGVNRRWLLDESKNLPTKATRIPSVMTMFPPPLETFEFESIRDRNPQDTATECATTKAQGPMKLRSAFCYDKRTGAMVKQLLPEILRSGPADYAGQYTEFAKFGKYSFPHALDCVLDGHRVLQADVVNLSPEPSPDAALFKSPAGAIELDNCLTKIKPASAVSTPSPSFPFGYRDRGSQVTLSVIVDAKGEPQSVKVMQSGGKAFDEQAVQALRGWRFKPATCNGERVGTQISVEFNFRVVR